MIRRESETKVKRMLVAHGIEGGDWEIVEASDLEQGVENLGTSKVGVKAAKKQDSPKGIKARRTA